MFMTPIDTSALDAGRTTTAAQSNNASDAAQSQDRFLKLLVAQLNNQDPMNPLDNAQMTSQIAQLNTVTGIENLNATVTGMLSQLASMQTLQGAGMVGRDVLLQGNGMTVTEGVARGSFDMSTAADSVKVEVRSAAGVLLSTLDLGAKAAGRHAFEFDASAYPNGTTLQFKPVATSSGTAVTTTALQRAQVTSVSSENNALMLTLAGGSTVAYSNVKALL